MAAADSERKSQRFFWLLILVLLTGYAGLKYRHIDLALEAYEDQPLATDTTGAAK